MSNEKNTSAGSVDLSVDLPGIVEIFGRALYNEFGAIVRELVQNSHDSIIKTYAERGRNHKQLSDYRIDVHYDQYAGLLAIADNGSGMNADEVARDLNNFGKSMKRGEREQVLTATSGERLHIIGEYGVGFLSAMAASDEVEVWSKKVDSAPVRWTYMKGNATAKVNETNVDALIEIQRKIQAQVGSDSGTIVICHLSEDVQREYHVDEELIRDSLLRYTKLLPIPIYFNVEQISGQYIAWSDPRVATEEDWREMIEDMTGNPPLLVVPIYSPPSELDLEGVLWIPKRMRFLDDAQIDVYVRRLFITSDDHIIKPEWSRFVMGMINSNKMGRIVSGNTIIEDIHAREVRQFIENKLIEIFKDLRALPEDEYWKIVGPHDDTIKKSALDNEVFFDCVWDKLRVRARSRRLTIPEYLAVVERKIGRKDVVYFYDKQAQEFSANMVSDATGLPILALCGDKDYPFVDRVCDLQNLELRSYRDLADATITRPEDEESYKTLVAACASQNIAAEVRHYQPNHIPAMLIEDSTLQNKGEDLLRGLRNTGEKRFAEDLAKLFAREHAANRGVAFYLNSTNSLIQQLRNAPFETQQAICLALYHISYMSAAPELKKNEIQLVYNSITSVLMSLLKQERIEEFSSATPESSMVCKPTRLFMITPFAEKYSSVEAAVRDVFESAPYFFELVLARDFMYENKLLPNIRAHIDAADGFIAEITELNENVMLELGAVLIKNEANRPVFSLRGSSAPKEVPADIRETLFIPYDGFDSKPERIADQIRGFIERNGQPHHRDIIELIRKRTCLALTRAVLAKCRLEEKEVKVILKFYPTVEELLNSPTDDATHKTGLSRTVIRFVQDQLQEFVATNK
jgi:molecular chaperone HtpG